MRYVSVTILVFLLIGVVLLAMWLRGPSLVDESRLIVPTDREHWRERLRNDIPESFVLETTGEPILVTDPTYLADVHNDSDEPAAVYLRKNGVILLNFGGDVAGPVWWKPPYLLIPLSLHLDAESRTPPRGTRVLAKQVGCDSGSFIFLPLKERISQQLRQRIDTVVREENGAILTLPAGRYQIFYEQFDAPAQNMVGLYRNIVAKKL
jgi:hypothetical protein